ncbi:hypothetical protein ES703_15635 [subsurface metagenome]
MCFTPFISLTTAIIEFAVATFILIRYKKYLVPVFSAILIYVLGFYQFTEFMLCSSGNPFLWAKIGFITYTFLPAIGLHFILRLTKNKKYNKLIYLIPIFFAIITIITPNFILKASCSKVFVTVQHVLASQNYANLFPFYLIYYIGALIFMGMLLFILIKKERNKLDKKIEELWFMAGLITILIPLILILILPALKIKFPSIYCEFALLFTIAALISSSLYVRKKKKEKI